MAGILVALSARTAGTGINLVADDRLGGVFCALRYVDDQASRTTPDYLPPGGVYAGVVTEIGLLT